MFMDDSDRNGHTNVSLYQTIPSTEGERTKWANQRPPLLTTLTKQRLEGEFRETPGPYTKECRRILCLRVLPTRAVTVRRFYLITSGRRW